LSLFGVTLVANLNNEYAGSVYVASKSAPVTRIAFLMLH